MNKQTNKVLDELVQAGTIFSYELINVDENGKPGAVSAYRNTERLVLTFGHEKGLQLQLDTFCSGCAENTVLYIAKKDPQPVTRVGTDGECWTV